MLMVFLKFFYIVCVGLFEVMMLVSSVLILCCMVLFLVFLVSCMLMLVVWLFCVLVGVI